MGFLDKAKKLADQAQSKLDEVQKDFNSKQGSGQAAPSSGSSVEFDQHGRPVAQPAAPPAPTDKSPTIDPGAPSAAPAPAQDRPHGDPLLDETPKPPAPPSSGSGLSSGDPLGG